MSGSERPPATEPLLRVRALEGRYPDFRLGPVSFELRRGETLVVLGPNGSGKSTLLRLLAGLEPASAGTVELAGRDLTGVPAHLRSVGMVFQDLALFPHRTVWENVTYGLEVRHLPHREVESRGEELLRQFRLTALSDRLPQEISGGERQRVALARAIAPSPDLLLFDEPLSAADPRVARELQEELRAFLQASSIPGIYVTHDLEEGFFLGDRLALLDEGEWVQEGTSEEVFEHPRSAFAAAFLGYHVLEGPPGTPGAFAVAPRDLRLVEPGRPGSLAGTVVRWVGGPRPRCQVRVDGPSGRAITLDVLPDGIGPWEEVSRTPGAPVGVEPLHPLPLPPRKRPNGFKKGEGSGPGGDGPS